LVCAEIASDDGVGLRVGEFLPTVDREVPVGHIRSVVDAPVRSVADGHCRPVDPVDLAITWPGFEPDVGGGQGYSALTFEARGPRGFDSMSNVTFSPPFSRSKSIDSVRPSRWKK
jgi:hypothetical protein